MSAELAFYCGLILLILAVAAFAIGTREDFAAIVAFVAYGLLVSLAWMSISSPDVALTEAAVGSGVTGALLLGASARLRMTASTPAKTERRGRCGRTTALIFSACVSAALVAVVLLLPEPPPTLAPDAKAQLATTGLGNPVTAVLMSFRALDTLLEKVVLLLALVGVWSFAPDRFWGERPAFGYPAQSYGALVFLTRILVPVGVLAGVFQFWVGADAPGGAFQGGAILSAMWILGFLSGLAIVPRVDAFGIRLLLTVGVFVFLAAGLAGFALASGFLAYPEEFAKPIILLIEVGMTLSVAVTLGLLVAGPPGAGLKP